MSATALVLVTSLTVGARTQTAQTNADAQRVMERARQAYATLASWRFEHKVVIQETQGTSQPMTVADVTLTTANAVAPRSPAGIAPESLCSGRCRLESTTGRGRVLIVRDGDTAWLYSSARGEYMKGGSLRDISTSVAGSMMLAVHLVPLMSHAGEGWAGVRLLSDEPVEVAGSRRDCYVVEVTLKPAAPPGPDTSPSEAFSAFSSASGFFMLLQIQGLGDPTGATFYVPPPSSPEPTRVRLWIDKERYLVLRRTVTENVLKQSQQESREVQLRLVDTFTAADVAAAVPEALFRFQPPDGAKEVPNIRAR